MSHLKLWPVADDRYHAAVIHSTQRLQQFERWYTTTRVAPRSYAEALVVFTALWQHARQVSPEFPTDWREDVQADIELARVLNGVVPRR